jgi:hypothetical protein
VVLQEVEHALSQQRGRVGVVRGQARVGEVVLVAGIEEQLRVLGRGDELARGVDVAFADDLVGKPRLSAYAIPSSIEPKVRPSKRSGVWIVWPALRSSSANARNPSVCPCAWWNSSTSAKATLLVPE